MTLELFNDIDQPRSPGGIEELVESDRKFERGYVVIEHSKAKLSFALSLKHTEEED